MTTRVRRSRRRQKQRGPATTDAAAVSPKEEAQEETGSLRRCVVTRERLPKERMIRFVVGPDRALVPDLAARLPGRGMWLSASRDVLEPARDRDSLARAFARAARGPVTVPQALPVLLHAALVGRIGCLLGLARRIGQAVAGYEKAREWLCSGQARLVVVASDGGAAELARLLSGSAAGATVVAPLPAAALGRILGRDHVVHVAIATGRLAERLFLEAGRLAGLRGEEPSERTHLRATAGGTEKRVLTGKA